MVGHPDPHVVLAEHRRRVAAGVARARLDHGIDCRFVVRPRPRAGFASTVVQLIRGIRRPRPVACCTNVSPCCA